MKKEHFDHIIRHFNATRYNIANSNYRIEIEGSAIASQLYVDECASGFGVEYRENCIIGSLPTREIAEEVIQYIKDTEMLFI